ncbi:putative membrane protein [Campylobacter lari]
MEFTILVLLAISILLILIKPEKEKLIFRIFLCGALLNYFMYLVASFDSIIPSGNW